MFENLNTREKAQRRYKSLWQERSSWDAKEKEISRFIFPQGGQWTTSDAGRGTKKHGEIIDNTALRARRVLSAGLMAGMTSPARPWFRLSTPDEKLNEYDSVKDWLNDVTAVMRNVFSRSNTYGTLHSIYDELGAFGTGASVVYDDFNSVILQHPLTFGEYAIGMDYRRAVASFTRVCQYTVLQVVQDFGLNNCSANVKNQYERRNYEAKVDVVHVIEERADRNGKRGAKGMRFSSVFYEPGGLHNVVLRESGFHDFPVLAPRWRTTGGGTYGSGPGEEALGDAVSLQLLQLRKSQGIDYQTNPPLQLPTALRNVADILPGGLNYYDQSSASGGIRSAFNVNLDLTGLREEILDTRQRIERTFYVDLFLMLASQDIKSGVTAREIAERHEEKLLMLGPVLEGLFGELLSPLIDLTFARMIRTNLLPPPPPELQGMELKVEFVSTLAQAQRAVGLQAVDRLLGTVGNIALQVPGVWDKIDSDRVVDIYSDMLGVDPDMVVAGDQVALIRQQKAQAAAQQQMLANAPAMAGAARDLSQADTTGSNGLTDFLGSSQGFGQ